MYARDALQQLIMRARYQAIIHINTVKNPELPSPQGYGWNRKDNAWFQIMNKEHSASNAAIQLVKCGCSKSKCDHVFLV